MTKPLSPELLYTTYTAVFTGLIWIPIVINRLNEMGVWPALRNPQPDLRPRADWAYRAACAHRNAIENLIVFAPLAICVDLLGLGNSVTTAAAAVFFVSRVSHALIYAFGIPLLRTIAFAIGFACQLTMALRTLSAIDGLYIPL